jgi:predicted CoA-binding protein
MRSVSSGLILIIDSPHGRHQRAAPHPARSQGDRGGGLSADWFRPSYFAAKYMQEHGYRVIPVNPKYAEILGEKCYPSLCDIPEAVDIVDVFRKTADVPPIAEDAIRIGAKVLWQQLGVRNEEAAARARAAGLLTVMDRCVKIEHGRLFGA